MAKQKKLSKIAEAVEGILGDSVKKKKLKKKKALKRFIEKMEAKQKELQAGLEKGDYNKDDEKVYQRHLETLDKQIKKANQILKEMEE